MTSTYVCLNTSTLLPVFILYYEFKYIHMLYKKKLTAQRVSIGNMDSVSWSQFVFRVTCCEFQGISVVFQGLSVELPGSQYCFKISVLCFWV